MLAQKHMTRDPVCVEPDDPVAKAASLMKEHGFRHLPVRARGKLVGIVSDRDVLGTRLRRQPVSAVMTADPAVISPSTPLDEAARVMRERRIHALPVVDRRRRLLGILTSADILDAFVHLSGVREMSHLVAITASAAARNVERKVRRLVDRYHGDIRWMHVERNRQVRAQMRVRCSRIDDVLAALEAEGYDVALVVGTAPGAS